MNRILFSIVILLAGCSGATGPTAVAPPVGQLHDPEIWFHFRIIRDTLGDTIVRPPYPDTAVMRWYRGTPVLPRDPAKLLARVSLTGSASVCAYFLVPAALDTMYFDLSW